MNSYLVVFNNYESFSGFAFFGLDLSLAQSLVNLQETYDSLPFYFAGDKQVIIFTYPFPENRLFNKVIKLKVLSTLNFFFVL